MPGSAVVIAFAVALLTLWVLLSRFGRMVLDRPNERSLHLRPVPRTGGVAVLLGAAAGAWTGATPLWLPALCAALLALLSFIDDVRGVPTVLRFAAHLAAAAPVSWYLLPPLPALGPALSRAASACALHLD